MNGSNRWGQVVPLPPAPQFATEAERRAAQGCATCGTFSETHQEWCERVKAYNRSRGAVKATGWVKRPLSVEHPDDADQSTWEKFGTPVRWTKASRRCRGCFGLIETGDTVQRWDRIGRPPRWTHATCPAPTR